MSLKATITANRLQREVMRDWSGRADRTVRQAAAAQGADAAPTVDATDATNLFILDLSYLDGTDVML